MDWNWLKIYKAQKYRIESFCSWPIPNDNIIELTAAGLIYTQKGCQMSCFECKCIVRHWIKGKNPWLEHKALNPKCRFINGESCGNIPVEGSPSPDFKPRDPLIPQSENVGKPCQVCEKEPISVSNEPCGCIYLCKVCGAKTDVCHMCRTKVTTNFRAIKTMDTQLVTNEKICLPSPS